MDQENQQGEKKNRRPRQQERQVHILKNEVVPSWPTFIAYLAAPEPGKAQVKSVNFCQQCLQQTHPIGPLCQLQYTHILLIKSNKRVQSVLQGAHH